VMIMGRIKDWDEGWRLLMVEKNILWVVVS